MGSQNKNRNAHFLAPSLTRERSAAPSQTLSLNFAQLPTEGVSYHPILNLFFFFLILARECLLELAEAEGCSYQWSVAAELVLH